MSRVDWTKKEAPTHLSVVVRALLQLTIDITNVASVAESGCAQRVREYFLCLLHLMRDGATERLFASSTEVEWFLTLAWNLAVFCSSVADYADASFFWRSVYCFAALLPVSADLLNTQRQALTLAVATYLQASSSGVSVSGVSSSSSSTASSSTASSTASTGTSTAAITTVTATPPVASSLPTPSTTTTTIPPFEDTLTLPSCLSLIHTCRNVLAEIETNNPPQTTIAETRCYLAQLETVCLVRLHSNTLMPRIKEWSSSHAFTAPFFVDLYHLLEQEDLSDPAPKKECLRTALQMLMQQPTVAVGSVCEVIHCLLGVCESREEEYHWVQQLLQIVKMQGESVKSVCESAVKCRNDEHFAYFTVQMWNCGVYYQRLNNLQDAEKFMSVAIQLTAFCPESMQVATDGLCDR